MRSTLEKRIAKVETVALPEPVRSAVLLCEPPGESPQDSTEEYRTKISEAESRGDFVICLVPLRPLKGGNDHG